MSGWGSCNPLRREPPQGPLLFVRGGWGGDGRTIDMVVYGSVLDPAIQQIEVTYLNGATARGSVVNGHWAVLTHLPSPAERVRAIAADGRVVYNGTIDDLDLPCPE